MSFEPCLTRFWYILDKICDWKFDRTCSIRHVVKVRLVSRVYSVKIDHLFEPQTGWFFLLTTLKPKWNKLYFWTDGWFIWKCRVWKFYSTVEIQWGFKTRCHSTDFKVTLDHLRELSSYRTSSWLIWIFNHVNHLVWIMIHLNRSSSLLEIVRKR